MKNKKAIALIFFYFILAGLLVVFGSFMGRNIVENRAALNNRDKLQACYLAEAGADQAKRGLYDAFRQIYPLAVDGDFSWFDSLPDSSKYTLPTAATLTNVSNGSYTVSITNVNNPFDEVRDITLVSAATVNNISETVTMVIRYQLTSSDVFDYAYFVNNYGWFWGGGITSQGDVRSNGDFNFRGNPKVNGDVYASENSDLSASGDIIGSNRNDNLDYYRNHADSQARPTDPTADPQDIDGDGVDEQFPYPHGYDGESGGLSEQEVLAMPYLGDLGYYKSLATSKSGTIKQGGVTLANNVLDDNIVLVGTASSPIVIDGPVVVTGDVLIRGVVSGQGTIFSGRNTHIIGDITYENPPAWPKPDTTPGATDTTNASRDFLGLATKGNVIVGDYTRRDWQRTVGRYLKPPFTQGYQTDSTDSAIGYDSDGMSGNGYWFDGNYTGNDGGTKEDGSNRKYYESSYRDSYVQSIAQPSNQIRKVEAVTYTNHAFSGRTGRFTMNGSIVSRDEAIVATGSITMNYDLRAKNRGKDFYLPRALDLPHIQYFRKN